MEWQGGTMKIFALLTIAGVVAMAVTMLLGFEEPNGILLLVSTILLLTAPVAMLAHLSLTHELTAGEKRIWLRALTGRHAPAAWSVYLTSGNRREAIGRLTEPSSLRE
jgi:Mn2+/Fe2+ NRAMP family transporter